MPRNRKKARFDHDRKSLVAAGLRTVSDSTLICPLCWREIPFEDLSLDHIVPTELGGSRCILTCTHCNNEHGSMFDSHLAQFQSTRDGFHGHGTLRAQIKELGKEAAANIEWGDGFKNITIVGKASNPVEVAAMQEDAKAGRFGDLHLTIFYRYSKIRFQTGLLRCAYLALFKCFGYEYAKHDVVQAIRRRICDISLPNPRLGSLIGELRNGTLPYRNAYIVVPGNVNGVQFYLVVIQLRKKTTTYHFVFMPIPVGGSDEFFDMMERCSGDNDAKKFTIPHDLVFW